MNGGTYIYSFRFLQLSDLSPKHLLSQGNKRSCRQPKFMAFLGLLAGWEVLRYLDKLIRDTLFTLGQIHSLDW